MGPSLRIDIPLERSLHMLIIDVVFPPSTIFSPSRSRARGWQPSGFRCHPRWFPSVLDRWWRGLWQFCSQNQRYQKAVWATGNNPPCPRTYQGRNRSQRGHPIRNWTLWNKQWKALPASQCSSNNRYCTEIGENREESLLGGLLLTGLGTYRSFGCRLQILAVLIIQGDWTIWLNLYTKKVLCHLFNSTVRIKWDNSWKAQSRTGT